MAKPAGGSIHDLAFRHNAKPELGFEVFRLGELVERAARLPVAHRLETPQRPAFHTIYVGLRGRGSHIVDFTPVPIGAGYLTFVARGRVQQFVPDRGVDAWMLLFVPEVVAVDPRSIDPLRTPAVLDPAWAEPVLELADAQSDVFALVAQLVAEHGRPTDALQAPMLAALLRALLLRIERLAHRSPACPQPPPALSRFFTILERDHLRTRSVAHYARQAGLSPRRLGELLVVHRGRSTKEVIDERVVLELKRLLAHTDLSVKELAGRAGFADPTNLVKFFRHRARTTPQAWRTRSRTFLPSGRRS